MNKLFFSSLACSFACLSFTSTASAQATLVQAPQNVVQLEAAGTVDVVQDTLVLTLGAVKEGKDADVVQNQLKQALDAAIVLAREAADGPKMEVRTGVFSLSPRYGEKQQLLGWQGRAELVLEGADFALITRTAARVSSMTISRLGFELSREKRSAAMQEAQEAAIAQFKKQAEQLSKQFGFAGYGLREVSVNSSSNDPRNYQRAMAMSASMRSSDAPVPVEAGKTEVTVTVSGSVQMR